MMRIAALLAIPFAAILLIVLSGCPGPNSVNTFLPQVGTDFNCYKFCRDSNGEVLASFNDQFEAATKEGAEELMNTRELCPVAFAIEQVSCQPVSSSK